MAHRVPFLVAELGSGVDPFILQLFAALAEKERAINTSRALWVLKLNVTALLGDLSPSPPLEGPQSHLGYALISHRTAPPDGLPAILSNGPAHAASPACLTMFPVQAGSGSLLGCGSRRRLLCGPGRCSG
jgi:hypothetical protein